MTFLRTLLCSLVLLPALLQAHLSLSSVHQLMEKGELCCLLEVAQCYRQMVTVADSDSVRVLQGMTKDVKLLKDQDRQIAWYRQMLLFSLIGMLVMLVLFLILGHYVITARNKIRSMKITIQYLIRSHDQQILGDNSDEIDKNITLNMPADVLQHFKTVDRRIRDERLFVSPDFGRNELMRLLGVDKNILPSLVQRFSDTNVPGYINNIRMEYAVLLIKQHPEYTMSAVSEACGIRSSATFIRNFKLKYGMTPSEYRNQLEAGTDLLPFIKDL